MLNQRLIEQEYGFLEDVVFVDNATVALPPLRVQRAWREYIDRYAKNYDLNYPACFNSMISVLHST